jgi:ActR/RegA family two-component response regulator
LGIGASRSSEVAVKIKRAEQPKILVVDEDEQVRTSIEKVLEVKQVQVTTTATVDQALHLIDTEPFDVLLSDLHMTETGDGLAAVSAMHNKNPSALTLVYTGYPELRQALDVLLMQSDEVLVRPSGIPWLLEPIHEKLESRESRLATNELRVAAILERDVFLTIIDWLDRVERDGEMTRVPLSKADRTGYLPRLIVELAHRVRAPRKPVAKAVSEASVEHGKLRQLQGYSISMIVEESRITQVCIFETLYNSLSPEDFRLVLSDAKTITDECNSQLKQTLASFMRQAARIAA